MSKKTLPTLLTNEELMSELDSAPAEDSTTTEILEHKNDVIPFLSHYKIEPGTASVNKKLLYRLYKQYYSKDPIPSLNFHHIVGQFLGYYYNYSGGFYRLNQDNFRISAHMFKEHTEKRIEKTKSNTYRRHFEKFLQDIGAQPSLKYMAGYDLHDIYIQYCTSLGLTKPKLGRDNFHKFCKLYFKYKRIGDSRANKYAVEITVKETDNG